MVDHYRISDLLSPKDKRSSASHNGFQTKQIHQYATKMKLKMQLPAYANGTDPFSPVTLNYEWSLLGRLIFMVICATLGTIINGFFVATFFVERTLKKLGNVYLAYVGLTDITITGTVLPVSSVVMLSGQWDSLKVCHALHFITTASTYCYSLYFMFVASETYFRLCRKIEEYEAFLSLNVGMMGGLVAISGFLIAGLGVYLDLDYDYCQRLNHGNIYFRGTTFVIFFCIPFLVTMICLILALVRVRQHARDHLHYRRSQLYVRDNSTTNLNMIVYLLYLFSWMPYTIVVIESPDTIDSKYYYSAWFGLCRTIFANFLYSAFNRNFRRAFANLFYYCCCKSTVTRSFNNRNRRPLQYRTGTGDVRVHIMHQAICARSPQRAQRAQRAQRSHRNQRGHGTNRAPTSQETQQL